MRESFEGHTHGCRRNAVTKDVVTDRYPPLRQVAYAPDPPADKGSVSGKGRYMVLAFAHPRRSGDGASSVQRYCRSGAGGRGSKATDQPVRCNGGLGSVKRNRSPLLLVRCSTPSHDEERHVRSRALARIPVEGPP